ncbi:MAG TPA: ABC transporter permease [Actinobacteria bacterium]|nr:ABC transporter permease [Actinomycetota bacterium]
MKKFVRIGLKDILITLRDAPALAILLGMPMIIILILGSALGSLGSDSEMARIDVAIVNLDEGDIGKEIVEGITEGEELEELFDTQVLDDAEEAREGLERGNLAALLVIPEDFSDKINDSKPVKMNVFIDPGKEISASIFQNVVQSIAIRIASASVAVQTAKDVFVESKMVADERDFSRHMDKVVKEITADDALSAVDVLESNIEKERKITELDFYGTGMTIMFLLFGSMFGAFSLVKEREEKTLSRLLITPTSKTSIIGGKMLGIFFVGVVQFLVLFLFTVILGVHWGENLFGVFLLALGVLLAMTGLSVLFSSVAKNVRSVGAIAPLVVIVMALAGGSLFPVSTMPEWLQPIRYLTINGWALDGLSSLMKGAGTNSILPNFGALMAMFFAFFLLGVWRLGYEE